LLWGGALASVHMYKRTGQKAKPKDLIFIVSENNVVAVFFSSIIINNIFFLKTTQQQQENNNVRLLFGLLFQYIIIIHEISL
jgi:hypothetical protein